jgi:hypothetical protein
MKRSCSSWFVAPCEGADSTSIELLAQDLSRLGRRWFEPRHRLSSLPGFLLQSLCSNRNPNPTRGESFRASMQNWLELDCVSPPKLCIDLQHFRRCLRGAWGQLVSGGGQDSARNLR